MFQDISSAAWISWRSIPWFASRSKYGSFGSVLHPVLPREKAQKPVRVNVIWELTVGALWLGGMSLLGIVAVFVPIPNPIPAPTLFQHGRRKTHPQESGPETRSGPVESQELAVDEDHQGSSVGFGAVLQGAVHLRSESGQRLHTPVEAKAEAEVDK